MIGRSVSNIDTRAAERARLRRRSQTEGISQASHASDVRPRPSRSASKVVHRGYMSQRKSHYALYLGPSKVLKINYLFTRIKDILLQNTTSLLVSKSNRNLK